MPAYFLVGSDAEWRKISTYSTDRQAGSRKKEATDCINDYLSIFPFNCNRWNLNTHLDRFQVVERNQAEDEHLLLHPTSVPTVISRHLTCSPPYGGYS